MSFGIELQGDGFDRAKWLEEIAGLQEGLSPLCQQIGDLEKGWDREQLWLHRSGGIRGITIWQRDGAVRLSLPAGISAADFELAGELARIAQKHGAEVTSEEGDALDCSDGVLAALSFETRRKLWSAVIGSAGGEIVHLPVAGMFHLPIDPADAASGWDALEERAAARMAVYCEAFVTSQMGVKEGATGRILRLAVYSGIPTLMDSNTELVAVRRADAAHGAPMPYADFLTEMGGRIDDLGPFIYVAPED